MRTIRASEIGSFLFCARAWWYRRTGKPSQNEGLMNAGTQHHARHGRRVSGAGFKRRFAAVLLLLALLLLAFGLTTLLIG